MWLFTVHNALTPHDPGQGSIQCSRTHALLLAQSELTTHSGRQFGGAPKYPVKHEQDALPLITLHWAFCPQGDGIQGSLTTSWTISGGGAKIN